MPFVRYARDKRGYEQIWLVHAPARRGRPSRARVLYWYRSPPGVRVGREPFDPALRARLEAQYPEITFDWEQLSAAAVIPPVEIEPWRERRRAQREVRRGRPGGDDEESRDRAPAVAGGQVAEPPGEPGELEEGAGSEGDREVRAGDTAPRIEGAQAETAGVRRRRKNRRRRPRGPEGLNQEPAQSPPEPPAAPVSEDPTDRPDPSSD